MSEELSLQDCTLYLDRISAPGTGAPTGTSAAMAGTLAAALISAACSHALEEGRSEKSEEELRRIQERALSLRRDLLALVEHGAQAALAVAASRGKGADGERLKALLFASEVPLRTAESCHALLNLAMSSLSHAGVKTITEIRTGATLAFAGVVGGIVTSRTYLAGIPADSGAGVEKTRKRAERIFREAEALRTQIIDRVRQHLP